MPKANPLKTIKLDMSSVVPQRNGSYLYRYQINGRRKAVSLNTTDETEAVRKAKKLMPVVQSTSLEVISAHVKEARNIEKRKTELQLVDASGKYAVHPERAIPATVSEQLA